MDDSAQERKLIAAAILAASRLAAFLEGYEAEIEPDDVFAGQSLTEAETALSTIRSLLLFDAGRHVTVPPVTDQEQQAAAEFLARQERHPLFGRLAHGESADARRTGMLQECLEKLLEDSR